MKSKKDRREVKITLDYDVFMGPVDGLEERVHRAIEEDPQVCNDPEIDFAWDDYYVVGWRPATPKEIERTETARKRATEAAAKRKAMKEAADRAEYERLRKRFGDNN